MRVRACAPLSHHSINPLPRSSHACSVTMHERIVSKIGAQDLIIETGKLAKQADGAVTVTCGETIVIVTAVMATNVREGQSFFPLTVDYREKATAAGKFPGGY